MLKIIHSFSGINKSSGGPSFFILELLNCMSQFSNNVKSILIYYTSNNDINSFNNNVILIKKNKLFNKFNFSFKYFSNINKNENILIHIHGLWQFHVIMSFLFCIRNNKKYIISPHGMLEPWSLTQNNIIKKIAFIFYQKLILKKAVCIHATSNMEAMNIRNLGFNNHIAIIPNGINTNIYSIKNIYNLDNNFTFLFLSRIHKKKGIEILIDTFEKLKNDNININFKLLIYGDGDLTYINKIKNHIKCKDLNHSIFLNSPIYGEEKINMLKFADIFILPSFSENFGNVIAESLSCGTPVITTNTTPWEILNSTNSGWCIDVGVNPLYNLLKNILYMKKDELIQMSINSNKLVLNNFSILNTSNKHLSMYHFVNDSQSLPQPGFII